MQNLTGILSGVAGVYFVAAELSKQGHTALVTLRNAKGIDIICSNAKGTQTVLIQVKTVQGSSVRWTLDRKEEDSYAENLFYIFVCLNRSPKAPDYFIVPSKKVAHWIKNYYKVWLRTPGRKGQKHNENPMRTFKDGKKIYLNQWELLGL